jgi:hypothetical protein
MPTVMKTAGGGHGITHTLGHSLVAAPPRAADAAADTKILGPIPQRLSRLFMGSVLHFQRHADIVNSTAAQEYRQQKENG